MAVFLSHRGRLIPGQKVRVSTAPIVIGAVADPSEQSSSPRLRDRTASGTAEEVFGDRHDHNHSTDNARVTVQRAPGSRDIQSIEIICDCGEVIVLDFSYSADATA